MRKSVRPSVLVVTVTLLVTLAAARGQPDAGVASDPASPRLALTGFLEACRRGDYDQAAQYLSLDGPSAERGAQLAERLKAVLDRHIWFDLATISASPQGDLDDGLPPDTEEIARIAGPAGASDPVRLIRRADGSGWLFGKGTVAHIDGWYARLGNRWLLERLPQALLRPGPFDLLWWQWLALPVLALAATLVGMLLQRILRRVLVRVVRRSKAAWDDALLERLSGPAIVALGLVSFYLLLPLLSLYTPAERLLHHLVRGGLFVVFFWALSRSIEVGAGILAETGWALAHPAARSLLPLAARVTRVMVLAIAVVAVLSELGYPVASLVAGLGIGGLALALAAQKTVENLFGAFSIGADEPFRIGDFVRIEEFVGTVEVIGLRSTKIRTLDRTLITIPNGRLADMRLESLTARDRMRLSCVLGLEYGTSGAQMRQVLAGLERVLREHPKIWPDTVVVRFREFAAYSLDIEIMAWFLTADWGEFQLIRQEILLRFMEIVEGAGAGFAFPTQTLHVHQT